MVLCIIIKPFYVSQKLCVMYSVQNYNNQSRVFFQGHAKAVAVASHDKRIACASILILL